MKDYYLIGEPHQLTAAYSSHPEYKEMRLVPFAAGAGKLVFGKGTFPVLLIVEW